MKISKKATGAIMALALAFGGCAGYSATSSNTTVVGTAVAATVESTNYDTANPPTISEALAGLHEASKYKDSKWSTDDAQDLSGDEITAAGVYRISGTHGTITVNAGDEDKVVLILDGATMDGINIINADKVSIYTEAGTVNTVNSSASTDDEYDAGIWSAVDLTLSGSGTLTVNAPNADGIYSKDDLYVLSGTINVTAGEDGMKGKDSLTVADGTINITSGDDGLISNKDDDATKGYVDIEGGNITINSTGNAVVGYSGVFVSDGTLNITAGGGASSGKNDDVAQKGLKSDWYVIVEGGTLNINTADDGIHSNGATRLSGGNITIATGDDGVHAEVANNIDGATVTITQSNEGIEGGLINISAGTVNVTSSDDGINGSGTNTGTQHTSDNLTTTSTEDESSTSTTTNNSGSSSSNSGSTSSTTTNNSGTNSNSGDSVVSGSSVWNFGSSSFLSSASNDNASYSFADFSSNSGTAYQNVANAPAFGGGMGGGMDTDTGEEVNISGGTVVVNAEGDGIDSNGTLTISGGNTTVWGPTNGGNGSLDSNGTYTITGGTLLAVGSNGMPVNPSTTDGQGWIAANVSGNAGTSVSITDSSGNVLTTFTAQKTFGLVQYSAPAVTNGSSYTVTAGSTSTTVTAGTATASGMGGGAMGGGMGGGRRR
ncbi:MAG: carbohydrate-binding domain-containing protein [Corynebacterium sp.]|nr:carbohydrate-binding domain-containing protein [Corynebacterium sp.]